MTVRWFTDSAAAGPAPILSSFTPFEELHFAAIIKFARDPANEEWENLRCLDAAGTRIHDMSVGVKAAPATDKMNAAIAGGMGVRQWHNHPSQQSLSHFDWLFAAKSASIEVLALNNCGSIFAGRVVDWDDRLHHIFPWLVSLSADLEFYMSRLAKDRKLDFCLLDPLSKCTGHILNTALAMCISVRYAYRFEHDDQTVIDACSALQIVQDGLEYARLAIEQELEYLRLWKALKTDGDRTKALECMRKVVGGGA